jgi:hypothetical protein
MECHKFGAPGFAFETWGTPAQHEADPDQYSNLKRSHVENVVIALLSMEEINSVAMLLKLLVVLGLLTLLLPSMRNALIEALNKFGDNFRGGPPSQMHPSPADDAVLLRKRRRKQD